ncbi:TPA: hypothetical protein EYP45_02175 [Candidatus Peregrinibacteria bacterium]|nr:hypothetical protein [Candidatus Peregrinibacteria bacterium]
MNNSDEKFLIVFALGLLIFFIVSISEYFKKKKKTKEHKDFLKWLKDDDYSLYTKYKNREMDINDKFRIAAAKMLYSDSRKKGK